MATNKKWKLYDCSEDRHYWFRAPHPETNLWTYGCVECGFWDTDNAHDALVAALEAVEWAVPTPDADTDGACPSCFAGKPAKLWFVPTVRPTEFERENHMVDCQLAAALEAAK